MGKTPGAKELTKAIIEKYGILVNKNDIADILGFKSRTSTSEWIRRYGLHEAGRPKWYYAGDVAAAIMDNGGVPK